MTTTTPPIRYFSPQTGFALDVSDADHAAIRTGLLRSTWHKALTLSKADRAVFAALIAGEEQPCSDILRAVVAGLAAGVTRWGTSSARRVGCEPLVALHAAMPHAGSAAPVEIRTSVQTRTEYHDPRTQRALDHQSQVNQTLASDLTATRTTISTQQREIQALREALARAEYRAARAEKQANTLPEGVEADLGALVFAIDIMTGEQRQRVSDYRTGYRAGRNSTS